MGILHFGEIIALAQFTDFQLSGRIVDWWFFLHFEYIWNLVSIVPTSFYAAWFAYSPVFRGLGFLLFCITLCVYTIPHPEANYNLE